MTSIQVPDRAQLEEWLEQTGTDFYLCGQCEGLHMRALQDSRGVIDSRLFLEDYGLLATTEFEVRPGALLQVSADLGRLNMDFPILKIFLDVVDEALPQLVVAGSCHLAEGLSQRQFNHFVAATLDAVGQLLGTCEQLNYLFSDTEQPRSLLH